MIVRDEEVQSPVRTSAAIQALALNFVSDIETGDYTEAQSMEEVVIWLLGSECGCFLL